jgi:hypothetical protein
MSTVWFALTWQVTVLHAGIKAWYFLSRFISQLILICAVYSVKKDIRSKLLIRAYSVLIVVINVQMMNKAHRIPRFGPQESYRPTIKFDNLLHKGVSRKFSKAAYLLY